MAVQFALVKACRVVGAGGVGAPSSHIPLSKWKLSSQSAHGLPGVSEQALQCSTLAHAICPHTAWYLFSAILMKLRPLILTTFPRGICDRGIVVAETGDALCK
jgi:hypothetical protein